MQIKKTLRTVLRSVTPQVFRDPLKRMFNAFFWRGAVYNEISLSLFQRIPLFKVRWLMDDSKRDYLILGIPVVTVRIRGNSAN